MYDKAAIVDMLCNRRIRVGCFMKIGLFFREKKVAGKDFQREKEFTISELRKYDGKEGRPAYFVCSGNVYDITSSDQWTDGEHYSMHTAGSDLTDALAGAPHGEEVLEKFKVVGVLKA